MADKVQLIKEEIERRIEQCYRCLAQDLLERERGEVNCCLQQNKELIQFIDSLPEEPTSEDLEEAASKYVREDFHERSRADFKAGAEWQKQQMKEVLQTEYEKGQFDTREEMMKDAVDGEYWDGSIYLDNRPTEYKDGDKVKIIIVKEN